MPTLDVDGTRFTFPEGWQATQFDEWPAYRKVSGGKLQPKGCDIVAVDNGTLYLIEAKDYTYPDALHGAPTDLPITVGRKALDTLALLFAWSRADNADQRPEHQEFLRAVADCRRIRVCLHIQLKDGGRGAIAVQTPLANIAQELGRLTKRFSHGKPIVASHNVQEHAPWSAARLPETRTRHRDR